MSVKDKVEKYLEPKETILEGKVSEADKLAFKVKHEIIQLVDIIHHYDKKKVRKDDFIENIDKLISLLKK